MIHLYRYYQDTECTMGVMIIDGLFRCHTIENPWLDNQRSISCIPDGVYTIKQRKELTPKTTEYRNRFDWFDWHFEIQDVPGRDYIYIHVGNSSRDVDGCICVQSDCTDRNFGSGSRQAFEKIYPELYEHSTISIQTLDPMDVPV